MLETDEFVSSNSDGFLMDSISISTAYLKMKNLCTNIQKEIQADIKIHNQNVLPRYILMLTHSLIINIIVEFDTIKLFSCQLYSYYFYIYWQILPISSSIDLSNITAAIYSTELCNRIRAFLAAWPPSGPQPHVNELLVAIAEFERNLESWDIRSVNEIWAEFPSSIQLIRFLWFDFLEWNAWKCRYKCQPANICCFVECKLLSDLVVCLLAVQCRVV